MNLLKMFILNNLLIRNICTGSLYNPLKISRPLKLTSIQNIKKSFFKNNIYYDLYNDFCSSDMDCINDEECNIYLDKDKTYVRYNSLTAEHIFPQSYLKEYKGADKDMHNIYLTSPYCNYHRSNYKYIDEERYFIEYLKKPYHVEFDDDIKITGLIKLNYNNYKNDLYKLYIPCINIRGPISRAVIYMKYQYPNIDMNMVLDDDLIIEWNEMYPPTDLEKDRNKKIEMLQGNRNPFISGEISPKSLIYPPNIKYK